MGFYYKLFLITIINSSSNYFLSISIIITSIIIFCKYLQIIQFICLKFNSNIKYNTTYSSESYIISIIIIFLLIGFIKPINIIILSLM